MDPKPFVTWYDPKVICEPVWDGTATPYLLANGSDVSMPSSLCDGPSRQHAKPTSGGGSTGRTRGNGVVSQSIGRV
jgi:hypothetical protein